MHLFALSVRNLLAILLLSLPLISYGVVGPITLPLTDPQGNSLSGATLDITSVNGVDEAHSLKDDDDDGAVILPASSRDTDTINAIKGTITDADGKKWKVAYVLSGGQVSQTNTTKPVNKGGVVAAAIAAAAVLKRASNTNTNGESGTGAESGNGNGSGDESSGGGNTGPSGGGNTGQSTAHVQPLCVMYNTNFRLHWLFRVTDSVNRQSATTLAATPGGVFSISITGPGTNATSSGIVNNNNQVRISQFISSFGTYSWRALSFVDAQGNRANLTGILSGQVTASPADNSRCF